MVNSASLSVADIPPSLAGFKSIPGIQLPQSTPWSCDTLPFLLPASQLHYDYPHHPPLLLDHSQHPSFPSYLDIFDSPAMHSTGPPPYFPGALTLPGPSSAMPSSVPTRADITQSIRDACSVRETTVTTRAPTTSGSRTTRQDGQPTRTREKKHACWMCEKSFDRPSTLRKVWLTFIPDSPHRSSLHVLMNSWLMAHLQHLLVHTGEKGLSSLLHYLHFTSHSHVTKHLSVGRVAVVSASHLISIDTSNAASLNPSTGPSSRTIPPLQTQLPPLKR